MSTLNAAPWLSLLVSLSAGPLTAQRPAVPTPASVLGFEPGADRRLPTWKQVTDYFAAIDRASPHVTVRTLGKTVLGRPFIAAFIADSATLANLERYRAIQRRLMDPRLHAAGERDRLVAEGKNVILITSSIHSTEVGGFLTPLVLADRLVRQQSAEAQAILANTIIMLVPSQNPDGVDSVGDWYRSTLGTPAEGSGPPVLYPIYEHTYGRGSSMSGDVVSATIEHRDQMLCWTREMRRSIDYAATRSEIDTTRLGFIGTSWGARIAGVVLAIEPRFRTAVLNVAGISASPKRPEEDPVNFLPRIHIPVLVLSGRYDSVFPYETSQQPFLRLPGTPAADKKQILFEGGHFLPRTNMVAESLRWFDEYFGPVARP
jgi:predicted esterase